MRREFPAKVKLAAWDRAKGRCEDCGREIVGRLAPAQYDHAVPDALGGEPTLGNCACLCRECHGRKTAEVDVPRIAKAKRLDKVRAGVDRHKVKLPFGRGSRLKRKVSGEVVER